jgi:hypothetical protein
LSPGGQGKGAWRKTRGLWRVLVRDKKMHGKVEGLYGGGSASAPYRG